MRWANPQAAESRLSHGKYGNRFDVLPDGDLKFRCHDLWRRAVLARDHETCVRCGILGLPVDADHRLPRALFPELALLLSNGRAMCRGCHKATPTYGGGTRREKYNRTSPWNR